MPLRLLSRFRAEEIKVPNCNLVLREPRRGDFAQWVSLRKDSSEFLTKWEPKWPSDDLTPLGFHRRLRSYTKQRQEGTGHTFFLFDRQSNELFGGLSLTKICHGISKSATLGYWMGVHHAGKGHMGLAVPSILSFAFNQLRLERVEAAALPTNDRSIHLLGKCGFQREGFAREYLEINGVREDHVLFACLKS
ncbi:MAG: GNAT family protein [Pseudomonadota bacterium]